MNNYKLQVLVQPDEGDSTFKDLFLNIDEVLGFYIPDDPEFDIVNLFFSGYVMTVLQEPHLIDYLTHRFSFGSINQFNYLDK